MLAYLASVSSYQNNIELSEFSIEYIHRVSIVNQKSFASFQLMSPQKLCGRSSFRAKF